MRVCLLQKSNHPWHRIQYLFDVLEVINFPSVTKHDSCWMAFILHSYDKNERYRDFLIDRCVPCHPYLVSWHAACMLSAPLWSIAITFGFYLYTTYHLPTRTQRFTWDTINRGKSCRIFFTTYQQLFVNSYLHIYIYMCVCVYYAAYTVWAHNVIVLFTLLTLKVTRSHCICHGLTLVMTCLR